MMNMMVYNADVPPENETSFHLGTYSCRGWTEATTKIHVCMRFCFPWPSTLILCELLHICFDAAIIFLLMHRFGVAC
jgi:hypothetical protein